MTEQPCDRFPDRCPNLRDVPAAPPQHGGGVRCGCHDPDPAAELRAAEERIRMGDPRIDITLRGALRDVLDEGVRAYAASVTAARSVWGDENLPEAREFIARNDATAELLALARAINGTEN